MDTRYYMYEELLNKALENPTKENLDALALWCDVYGNCWNGECYDISDIGDPSGSRLLFPIYGEPDENDCYPIIGYRIE